MIQIPDEVRNTALAEFESVAARSSVGTAVTATWRVIAEWARKEALDEVLCEAGKNRVIMVTHHAGYTVENYADPLVKIAVLRALAEGVRS